MLFVVDLQSIRYRIFASIPVTWYQPTNEFHSTCSAMIAQLSSDGRRYQGTRGGGECVASDIRHSLAPIHSYLLNFIIIPQLNINAIRENLERAKDFVRIESQPHSTKLPKINFFYLILSPILTSWTEMAMLPRQQKIGLSSSALLQHE